MIIGAVVAVLVMLTRVEAEKPLQKQDYAMQREYMVRFQLEARGIRNPQVLAAMRKVERHLFVPKKLRSQSYTDGPLPIGEGQTISQPYIVALMTQLLEPAPDDIVLEIGTGSGYQAAVLAECVREVYTIEIVELLCKQASERLKTMGYDNIHVRCGDGYKGWPEKAPFNKIILTCAPDKVPQPLLDQLAEDGILVAPVGTFWQELKVYRKKDGKITSQTNIAVRFVPMTGEAEKR